MSYVSYKISDFHNLTNNKSNILPSNPCILWVKLHIISVTMMASSNGNISTLLALCQGNSPVTRVFTPQRPVMRSLDIFFDVRPNKRLSEQVEKTKHMWSETPLCSLWRHYKDLELNEYQKCRIALMRFRAVAMESYWTAMSKFYFLYRGFPARHEFVGYPISKYIILITFVYCDDPILKQKYCQAVRNTKRLLKKLNRHMSRPDLWSIDQSLVNKADSGS